MKSIQLCLFALCMTLVAINVKAQRVKLTEGNASALKNEKTINVEFTYDDMKVGKYNKEQDFINHKIEELNKKEAGTGDTWAKKWVDDRSYKFEPKFNEQFLQYCQITGGVQKDSKYTLIFHTTFTEPGFSAGWPVRKSAEIKGEAIIVETANRSNILAKIGIEKAMGSPYGGFDFDTGVRITDAYGEAGKAIGIYIRTHD